MVVFVMNEAEQPETLLVLELLLLDGLEALEGGGIVLRLNVQLGQVELGLEVLGVGQDGLFVVLDGLRLVLN